jgi:hypothetical protein
MKVRNIMIEKLKKRITSSQINYSQYSDIEQHRQLLSPEQQNVLDSAFSPVKRGNFKYSDSYFDNAGLIVGAEPVYAVKFSRCGIPNLVNHSGRCSKRQFCPRCAYVKFLQHWSSFEHAYRTETYCFVTFSYQGNVSFSDRHQCTLYWDAIQSGLKWLSTHQHIEGGLVSEEISVRSFVPTLVLPHAHAILKTEQISPETITELGTHITGYQDQAGNSVQLVPSVNVKPIQNYDSFKNEMQYLFKPINLKTAYVSAWIEAEQNDRSEAWKLNSALKDFFSGHLEITRGRMMIRRFGSMHGRCKEFVGQKRKKFKKRKLVCRNLSRHF